MPFPAESEGNFSSRAVLEAILDSVLLFSTRMGAKIPRPFLTVSLWAYSWRCLSAHSFSGSLSFRLIESNIRHLPYDMLSWSRDRESLPPVTAFQGFTITASKWLTHAACQGQCWASALPGKALQSL